MVKHISITTENKDPKEDPSHEGFDISKDNISLYSKSMTRLNANILRLWFTKSSKIMNRDLVLVMYEPKNLTLFQSLILWVFKRWFI